MSVGATLGWFALLLQLWLTVQLSLANGKTVVGAVVLYFGFFTILTNVLIAAQFSFTVWIPSSRLGRWFSQPAVQGGSAVYIATVAIVYSLLLRHIWNPRGLQKLADHLLHDAIPLLYLGYWLLFARKRGLRWRHALQWLVYPLAYLAYTLVRGAVTGVYPYPFLDVGELGYGRVMGNAAMLTAGFLGLGLLFVAIGRARAEAQTI